MTEYKSSDAIQLAIKEADPFRRQGTAYLHTRDNQRRGYTYDNPTGAVVVPISVATTFEQRDPGVARAKDDPNSFGAGYEYSRTGKYIRLSADVSYIMTHFDCSDTVSQPRKSNKRSL
jgi:hypothetical protein